MMNSQLRRFYVTIAILLLSLTVSAQTFVATVIAVQGDVKIFHVALPGDHGPQAKLHNQNYTYHSAKIGEKLNPGEIILCGTTGKIRVVYPNGDTFFVGSGSAFVLPVVTDKQASRDGSNSTVKMFYGEFRALISKRGPRNRLRVVTPDVIAGVRGTDFFTQSNASSGTQLTVLRGSVAVRAASQPSKIAIVKTGYSADAILKVKTAPRVSPIVRATLSRIRDESNVKVNESAIAALPKPEQNEIHNLQKNAYESVMADVQDHNPALYQDLKKQAVKNVDQVNSIVVADLSKKSPPMKKQKPAIHYRHPVVH